MADSQVAEPIIEQPTTEPAPLDTPAASFDMAKAVEQIGASLFPPSSKPTTDDAEEETTPTPIVAAAPPEPLLPAPTTWPEKMHDHWGKLPHDLQTYWQTREKQMLDGLDQYKQAATFGKSLNDVLQPYQQLIAQQGLDAPRAVHALLQAHTRLTQGSLTDRQAAYQQLGKNLGLEMGGPSDPPIPVDPQIKALQDQFYSMQQTLTAQEQVSLQEAQTKVGQEIEAFAADPLHPHFDEVTQDIVLLVKAGLPLQEAYEKAVWSNPVTRAKELAKQQTADLAKVRENARLAALPTRNAASINVKSRDAGRTPTEPLGTMQDTMKQTLAAIRARAS